jgi:hypothetical protein
LQKWYDNAKNFDEEEEDLPLSLLLAVSSSTERKWEKFVGKRWEWKKEYFSASHFKENLSSSSLEEQKVNTGSFFSSCSNSRNNICQHIDPITKPHFSPN